MFESLAVNNLHLNSPNTRVTSFPLHNQLSIANSRCDIFSNQQAKLQFEHANVSEKSTQKKSHLCRIVKLSSTTASLWDYHDERLLPPISLLHGGGGYPSVDKSRRHESAPDSRSVDADVAITYTRPLPKSRIFYRIS